MGRSCWLKSICIRVIHSDFRHRRSLSLYSRRQNSRFQKVLTRTMQSLFTAVCIYYAIQWVGTFNQYAINHQPLPNGFVLDNPAKTNVIRRNDDFPF